MQNTGVENFDYLSVAFSNVTKVITHTATASQPWEEGYFACPANVAFTFSASWNRINAHVASIMALAMAY